MSRVFLALLAIVGAGATTSGQTCPVLVLQPGGERIQSRFLAVPLLRASAAVEDAMHAAGAVTVRNTGRLIEMQQVKERITALNLLEGDEAIVATLTPGIEHGVAGTAVTVETKRGRFRDGFPRRAWSAAVVREAVCLTKLMPQSEPVAHARGDAGSDAIPAAIREVIVPAGTPVTLRLKRFVFSPELRANQRLPLEVALDVVVDGAAVFLQGALASARFVPPTDNDERGGGGRGVLVFDFAAAADSGRIPLQPRGEVVAGTLIPAKLEGLRDGFALRAGTLLKTAVREEHRIRISSHPQR